MNIIYDQAMLKIAEMQARQRRGRTTKYPWRDMPPNGGIWLDPADYGDVTVESIRIAAYQWANRHDIHIYTRIIVKKDVTGLLVCRVDSAEPSQKTPLPAGGNGLITAAAAAAPAPDDDQARHTDAPWTPWEKPW